MGADDDRPRVGSAEAVLAAMRRSVELVQELLQTTAVQAEHIRSVEHELLSARQRVAFLEGETSQLRQRLREGIPGIDPQQLEELIEEQNTFAHLFVTSDRLARARAASEVVEIADEVLANLIGADRFAVWLQWQGALPVLSAPPLPRWRSEPGLHKDLVTQTLATGSWSRPPGVAQDAVPVAVPILLDGNPVGAMLIVRLVPQVGHLGRLQDDLLRLLSERVAPSLCLTALRAGGGAAAWAGVRGLVPALQEAP